MDSWTQLLLLVGGLISLGLLPFCVAATRKRSFFRIATTLFVADLLVYAFCVFTKNFFVSYASVIVCLLLKWYWHLPPPAVEQKSSGQEQ